MYGLFEISNYIIDYYYKKGKNISNLKLQKILYFIQAEFLIAKGKCCFCEKIKACNFGVIIPEIYYKYSVFGGNPIPVLRIYPYGYINKKDKLLINNILDECAKYSNSILLEIICNQKTWIEANKRIDKEITPEMLINFFKDDKINKGE